MDSLKYIKRIRAIQDEAKQELINFLKTNSSGPSIEIPENVELTDWAIEYKDGDERDTIITFITGIRLNDDGELEFKAEYFSIDGEHERGDWNTLYSGDTIKVNVGIETIYAFVINTFARKSYCP